MYTIYFYTIYLSSLYVCVCMYVCMCDCQHTYIFYSISIEFFISLDEIGIYDLSAMITFITNMRSQPLHTCVGHSMGTTCFYIMASERPEIARMVKMMINFGPELFINHMQSPLRFLVPFIKIIKVK